MRVPRKIQAVRRARKNIYINGEKEVENKDENDSDKEEEEEGERESKIKRK